MGFPIEERLKILIEQVADLERSRRAPNDYEDKVFHGVVVGVKTLEGGGSGEGSTEGSGSCPHQYIEVCPYQPQVSSAGHLGFDHGQHPLSGITDSTHRDRVFCVNVPSELLALYYPVGTIIDYWRFSGSGSDTKSVRGSYVTKKEDLSILSLIEWDCGCDDPSGSCSPTLPSMPADAFKYKATAVVFNPTSTTLADKFKTYKSCDPNNGTPFKATAYNFAELKNKLDSGVNATGTGANVDSLGRRLDTEVYDDDGNYVGQPADQYLVPLGPHLNKIYPFIDPNTGRCDFKEWYFAPVPNTFAFQTIDPTLRVVRTNGHSIRTSLVGAATSSSSLARIAQVAMRQHASSLTPLGSRHSLRTVAAAQATQGRPPPADQPRRLPQHRRQRLHLKAAARSSGFGSTPAISFAMGPS